MLRRNVSETHSCNAFHRSSGSGRGLAEETSASSETEAKIMSVMVNELQLAVTLQIEDKLRVFVQFVFPPGSASLRDRRGR